jgi:hypothetical protein
MATNIQNQLREPEVKYIDNTKKLLMSTQDVIDDAHELQRSIYSLKNELTNILKEVRLINELRKLEQGERDERNNAATGRSDSKPMEQEKGLRSQEESK